MGATAKGKKSVADASVVDSSEETASVSSTSSASLEDYGKTKGQKKSDASETTGRTGKTTTTTLCRSSNGLDTQSNNSADDDGGHFNDFSSKKKPSLAISANEWRGRVRNVCAKGTRRGRWAAVWLPVLLCFYAILKEIKVGEPFMFKYQTEYLNLTAEQLASEIYPFTPYSYLISLVPIFLLTDLLLYKPTMIAEVVGQIVFRSTLVFGGSVPSQVVGQIFYGMASASEVAFFSYIYARLEKNQYRSLTSWTRAGTMAGRSCGYLFSQMLIMTHLGTLRTLNIIALVLPCIVFVFAVFLPRVHWKIMVGRMLEAKGIEIEASSCATTGQLPKTYLQYVRYRIGKLRSDFIKIYSVGFIRKWSLWWAMTTCMSLQFALFSQTLWGEADVKDSPFNGFAEASYTATATLAILAMNAFPLDWDRWGELALVIISSIDAGMLFVYARTRSIYVMYACYIGYRSLYQVMITIAQWNIAKKMVCESYGLVFGTNSFIALIMQSVLTSVVSDRRGLAMHVRQQYIVYGFLHLGIAAIFLASLMCAVIAWCHRRWRKAVAVGDAVTTTSKHTEDSSSSSSEDDSDCYCHLPEHQQQQCRGGIVYDAEVGVAHRCCHHKDQKASPADVEAADADTESKRSSSTAWQHPQLGVTGKTS